MHRRIRILLGMPIQGDSKDSLLFAQGDLDPIHNQAMTRCVQRFTVADITNGRKDVHNPILSAVALPMEDNEDIFKHCEGPELLSDTGCICEEAVFGIARDHYGAVEGLWFHLAQLLAQYVKGRLLVGCNIVV